MAQRHVKGDGPPMFDFETFPHFNPLLEACTPFARQTGCRYTIALAQDIRGDGSEHDESRLAAAPMISEFAARLKAPTKGIIEDFSRAEKIVMREAVFKSLCSTCQSVDLWPPTSTKILPDDRAYEDTTAPLEDVAQRLYNFVQWRKSEGQQEVHQRRALAASFVLEFGLEHGLEKGEPDEDSERMLMQFLEQVRDYGEREEMDELKPSFDDELPLSVREQAEQWWQANWRGVAVGVGVVAAGAALLGFGMAMFGSPAGFSLSRPPSEKSDD